MKSRNLRPKKFYNIGPWYNRWSTPRIEILVELKITFHEKSEQSKLSEVKGIKKAFKNDKDINAR